MAEVLFTETEWRAVAAVEQFTDMDPYYYGQIKDFKKVYGSVFAGGNFWTGTVICGGARDGRIDYHVVERDSGMIFGHAHETRGEALDEARILLDDMGPLHFARLLAKRRAEYMKQSEARAEKEAQAAIAKAQADEKANRPRKVGKRARAVFEASKGQCHYCGVALTLDGRWHIEHKMPRALFGGSEQGNLVAACAPCNHAKRDRTDLEFIAAKQSA